MGSGRTTGGPLGRAVGPVPVHMQAFNGTRTWTKNIPQGDPSLLKGTFTENRWYHKAPQLCPLTE